MKSKAAAYAVFVCLLLMVLADLARAQTPDRPVRKARKMGAGVIILGPTGLSTNYRWGKNSLDMAFAWNTNPGTHVYVHSTYLFRYPQFFVVDKVPFLFFWGVGPRVFLETNDPGRNLKGRTMFAARASVGISYLTRTVPVEIFGEFALALNLIPNTFTDGSLGLGARYYF